MLPADVRVVAATTRNLAREIKRGGFREDLYFRMAVVSIEVPPLRARTQDIPLLAQKLLEAAGGAQALDRSSLNALVAYDWPGNVRELRNVLERAVHLSPPDAPLKLMGFPPARDEAHDEDADVSNVSFDENLSYRDHRARAEAKFERQFVRWVLARHDGNVAAAARAMRMDRNHLTDLARKHGVERRRR